MSVGDFTDSPWSMRSLSTAMTADSSASDRAAVDQLAVTRRQSGFRQLALVDARETGVTEVIAALGNVFDRDEPPDAVRLGERDAHSLGQFGRRELVSTNGSQ